MGQHSITPDLDQLRHQLQLLSIPSVYPDSPGFDKLARSYNRVFSYRPAVICTPGKDEDVSNAILCARDYGVKVQAKGGGHSYAAYSSGGKDDSLIIHMRNFSSVELNTQTDIAIVGAGVRLGQLAADLFRLGRRAVPHGTIKNVGVAGHFSHGGYGYQSRAWGLALDTIVGLDVVLADGRRLHITATEYPELFYVFRGAADSFGIITRFYLRTVPAPDKVTLFSYDIEGMVEDVNEATTAFLHIQQAAQDSTIIDRDISFGFYIHDGMWTIWGVFLRDQEHFENQVSTIMYCPGTIQTHTHTHPMRTRRADEATIDCSSPSPRLQETRQEIRAVHGMAGMLGLVFRQPLQRCHRGSLRYLLCPECCCPGEYAAQRGYHP